MKKIELFRKLGFSLTVVLIIGLSSCLQNDNLSEITQDDEETDTSLIDSSEDILDENVGDVLDENDEFHEEEGDDEWDESEEVLITLTGSSASVNSESVTIDGSLITIAASGTYRITGNLSDGSIMVDTEDEELVRLILDGVSVSSSTTAPVNVWGAEKVIIIIAEGSENSFTDSSDYIFEEGEDEPNAAFFSKANLSIYGSGKLIVNGNYNDAIASKDGLIIDGPEIEVNAVDDGIRGKDYLVLRNSTMNIVSGGDAFKSDEDEGAERGYILIESGNYTITTDGDGFAAETDLLVVDGTFNITAGGGSSSSIGDSSTKGMKAGQKFVISNGTFVINSSDDAMHANGHIIIEDGTFELATGDDGIHADSSLHILAGDILVSESYEGLESAVIQIDGGKIVAHASDDGLNVAGSNDSSGHGGPGGNGSYGSNSGDYYMIINDGQIAVYAQGDGLDANGSIEMTGGTVIVYGPTGNGNGALDYDNTFKISGGTLLAVGSSGMAQMPSSSSSQNSLKISFSSSLSAETTLRLEDSSGTALFTFTAPKSLQSLVFSSDAVAHGSYTLYKGGSIDGDGFEGFYSGGTYSGGSEYGQVSVSSSTNTSINL